MAVTTTPEMLPAAPQCTPGAAARTPLAPRNDALPSTSTKASAASSHAIKIHHYGTASPDIFFGVYELFVGLLADQIKPGRGIEGDASFWRFASQLTSGVADLHQCGLLHLAIQVERALCRLTHSLPPQPMLSS